MKAITIKQPWATLIALGEKQFETRRRQTKHRGPLAIHAGKSVDKEAFLEFEDVFKKHGIESIKQLPTGVVIATVDLKQCFQVIKNDIINETAVVESETFVFEMVGNEYLFGGYDEGRYAWQLTNVQVLPEPVPAKGQLSLWNWDETKEGTQK